MASPQLAIAKAAFSASLLRQDPKAASCSPSDIEHFHFLLSSAVTRCSPANVQKCKQWALRHLVYSASRLAAWAKYLVALANSFTYDTEDGDKATGVLAKSTTKNNGPSAKRKKLHLLYILNDILYHSKLRDNNAIPPAQFKSALPSLFATAAASPRSPKHLRKVRDLIDIWEKHDYFPSSIVSQIRNAVQETATSGAVDGQKNGTDTHLKEKDPSSIKLKNAPFVLPSMHGDPSTPWFDLPAANWLPVLEPNSIRPMNPAMIRPLQFGTAPPSKSLIDGVKKLLADVDEIYGQQGRTATDDRTTKWDIDPMGERVETDDVTSEIIGGDTYYGWSRAFCERMKSRRKGGLPGDRDKSEPRSDSRSRSRYRGRDGDDGRGRSLSRSTSPPAFKRRRLSRSRSRSRSGDSRAPSRSPSRDRDRGRRQSYSRDQYRRRSDSRSRSRSRPYSRSMSRSRSSSPSRSGTIRRRSSPDNGRSDTRSIDVYSPGYPQPSPSPYQPPHQSHPHSQSLNAAFSHPPPFPPPPFPNMHGTPQPAFPAMPPIPPPPAHYNGPWPLPPPPPPPPENWRGGPGVPPPPVPSGGGWAGGWGSAPTPPPPPMGGPSQQQQPCGQFRLRDDHGYGGRGGGAVGSGGGWNGYSANCGYGRGRGRGRGRGW